MNESDQGLDIVKVVERCPMCGCCEYEVVVSAVEDNVISAVDYTGNILQCVACKHAFLSPVLVEDSLHMAYRGYYTQSADGIQGGEVRENDKFKFFLEFYRSHYKGERSKKGWFFESLYKFFPLARFFLDRAVRFLATPSAGHTPRLLDVGCGSGDFLARAANCGYKVEGLDFDPATVEIAKSRGLTVSVSEIQDLPVDEKFDAITLSHVIEHVPDPVALLENIYQRLKPGCYFYIATPNFQSAGRCVFGRNWRGCDVPRHLHFFNTRSLSKLLETVGFAEVKSVYDLPQSLGIIKSSIDLKYGAKRSIFNLIWVTFSLFRYRFLASERLDVSVFKCKR